MRTRKVSLDLARAADLFATVAATVPSIPPPDGHRHHTGGAAIAPVLPGDLLALDARLVAPRWEALSRYTCRYLAARAFGAWSAYQGHGVRTQVAVLAAALAVLRVEAVRHSATAGRVLDETLLGEAFRSADLLTVHQSESEAVVNALGFVERGSSGEFFTAIGLEGMPDEVRSPSPEAGPGASQTECRSR